jgi:excisionase family DNA binding protein
VSAVADDTLLTAQEVARELGVADKTVRRWIETGRLDARKRGAVYAIRLVDALEAAGGRTSKNKAATLEAAVEHQREVAELRGRYLEAKDRIATLEAQLEQERGARIALELQARLAA